MSPTKSQRQDVIEMTRAFDLNYQNRRRPFDIVMPSAAAGDTPTGGTDGRDALIQRFSMLKEVGVTHTGPSTGRAGSMEESLERLQWFAEEIMPACR